MSKNNGGPAFPRPFSKDGNFTDSKIYRGQDGMTLRDYFAAKAMTYIQSRYEDGESEAIAREAYLIADAMLKEREK